MILNFNRPRTFVFLLIFNGLKTFAQPYAPPAGQAGTDAIYKDSTVFINWATGCHVIRGYQDISNPSLGLASVGDSSMATGKAMTNGVVSLGDGGVAVCTFGNPIKNGPGVDFAVFENGFNDTFLELAFVEVSSDGVNFVRFPSHSLSDTTNQFGNVAIMDATKLNNLAGKYRGGYGTPFDLQELSGRQNLDINAISHVKIIDVVGSLNKSYGTRDSYGNKINDPWPTPFPSSGFDLDAIGVIHENQSNGITVNNLENQFAIPNPVPCGDNINVISSLKITSVTLIDYSGKIVMTMSAHDPDFTVREPGIYLLRILSDRGTFIKKLIVL